MKRYHLLVLPVVVGLLTFSACQKSGIEYENAFEDSLLRWLDFKAESGNSYQFTVTGSTWSGYAWQTHLKVKDGKVIGRRFEYTTYDQIPMPSGGWTMEGAEELLKILTSKGWGGPGMPSDAEKLLKALTWESLEDDSVAMAWPPETLDHIYDRGRIWLMKKRGATNYFETDNNGLMSTCGYVLDGCMDDCFTGIHIKSIEQLSD